MSVPVSRDLTAHLLYLFVHFNKITAMKKNIIYVLLLLLFVSDVSAQLPMTRSTYAASYLPITLPSAALSTAAGDDVAQSSIPIGFTFNYLGINYSSIGVNTNGVASFETLMSTSRNNEDLHVVNALTIALSPWWDDLVTDSILYELKGLSPNRTFTIQWNNAHYTVSSNIKLNFQIVLHESTNVIEFCYDDKLLSSSTKESASIGIKGFGGAGEFLDAITGSAFTSNDMINIDQWPRHHFRFTPGLPSPVQGGNYTVGKQGQYYSLSEAIADMNHRGISGPVELSLIDDLYDVSAEHGDNFFPMLLGPVVGTSPSNTLSIKSSVGKSTIVSNGAENGTCSFAGINNAIRTNSEPIFALVGANFVRLDGLEFKSLGIVEIGLGVFNSTSRMGSSNNIFTNISVDLHTVVSDANTQGILQKQINVIKSSSGTNSNNKYYNLSIVGARKDGISLESGLFFLDSNNVIGNLNPNHFNEIINQGFFTGVTSVTVSFLSGIRAVGQKNVSISQNRIQGIRFSKGVANGRGTLSGIILSFISGSSHINNNVIASDISGFGDFVVSGISVSAVTPKTTINVFNNSVAISSVGVRKCIGIAIQATVGDTSIHFNVDNNTVLVEATFPAICFEVNTKLGPVLNLRNNIFVNRNDDLYSRVMISVLGSTSIDDFTLLSDFNNFFMINPSGSTFLAGFNYSFATLNDWKIASKHDSNSFAIDPQLTIDNLGILHTGAAALGNATSNQNRPWITNDIDSQVRSFRLDIGADEFAQDTPDVGISTLISPVLNGVRSAKEKVVVSLKNFGGMPIDFSKDSVKITFNITGIVVKKGLLLLNNNSVNANVPLAPGDSMDVFLGEIDMKANGPYTFNCYSEMRRDSDSSNDSMQTITMFLSSSGNTQIIGSDGTKVLDSNSALTRKVPNYITYQAKVRNASANELINTKVNLKFTIHQNNNLGPIVYEETQSVSTNRDGLVTVRIGNGKVTQGKFSLIDWSTGLYFLRTKVDVNGGTNFVLLSVNQFSSVPYVFYADEVKTMDYSGVKNVADVDSLHQVLAKLKQENSTLEQRIDSLANVNKGHFVGEHFGGGIVFYVYDNGKHGLISATSDFGGAIRWFGGSNTNTGATIAQVGIGLQNTQLIVSNQREVDGNPFAASKCLDFAIGVDGLFYSDWYLPSKDELNLMYVNRNIIGGFTTDSFSTTPNYWSSTESSSSTAFTQSFEDGIVTSDAKSTFFKIRPIRSF
jgi:hypothetical protein